MIVLITPTGARPLQFNLCRLFMQRQTYEGDVVWIIIDDGVPVTSQCVGKDFREGWEIIKIYPEPRWIEGQNTQVRNIKAGIDLVKSDYKKATAIFIIEDDDYYKPNYLERMIDRLDGFDITGEMNTVYYNVTNRRYFTNPNRQHSSLFQTAFNPSAIPLLENSYWHKFMDCEFWRMPLKKNLFNENNLSVGIKGLPGRGGIGAGHKTGMNMLWDRNLDYLKSLIGYDDTILYAKHYRPGSMQRNGGSHPGFLR